MKFFSEEDIKKVNSEYRVVAERHFDLVIKLDEFSHSLQRERAKEYLFHGVARRVVLVHRCIRNIFSIFPLEIEIPLKPEKLSDVTINLHAFLINIFGIMDNLAWVLVHERSLEGLIRKESVSLFKKKIQERCSKNFREYLDSEYMKTWYENYLKNYRDAITHRIPLYVPPKFLTLNEKDQIKLIEGRRTNAYLSRDLATVAQLDIEEDGIGAASPFFIHSLSSEDKYIALHAQIIVDFKTIEEVVKKFIELL